jgi:hypothetical protein
LIRNLSIAFAALACLLMVMVGYAALTSRLDDSARVSDAAPPSVYPKAFIAPAVPDSKPFSPILSAATEPSTQPVGQTIVKVVHATTGDEYWSSDKGWLVVRDGRVVGWTSASASELVHLPSSSVVAVSKRVRNYYSDGSSVEIDTFIQNGKTWDIEVDDTYGPPPVAVTQDRTNSQGWFVPSYGGPFPVLSTSSRPPVVVLSAPSHPTVVFATMRVNITCFVIVHHR